MKDEARIWLDLTRVEFELNFTHSVIGRLLEMKRKPVKEKRVWKLRKERKGKGIPKSLFNNALTHKVIIYRIVIRYTLYFVPDFIYKYFIHIGILHTAILMVMVMANKYKILPSALYILPYVHTCKVCEMCMHKRNSASLAFFFPVSSAWSGSELSLRIRI